MKVSKEVKSFVQSPKNEQSKDFISEPFYFKAS